MSSLRRSVLSVAVAVSALAQSFAASAAAPADSAPVAGDLEEILVTAQRRSESIMSVPVSITAFGGDVLKSLQIKQPADLLGQVPGLQVSSPTGDAGPIYAIRGVSENDYSPNQSGPIAVYTDGVYASGLHFLADQTFDLARVEVLRGPQGTLYGRNATGGAINFITAKPDFTTSGYVTGRVGNYGRTEGEGAFQTALNDELAVRVAANWINSRGFVEDTVTGQRFGGNRQYGVRLTFVYKPNDLIEATLRATEGKFGKDPYAVATVAAGQYGFAGGSNPIYPSFPTIPQVPANFNYFQSYGANNRTTQAVDTPALGASSYYGRTGQVSLDLLVHALPTLDIVSITSYGRGHYGETEDADQSPLALFADGGQNAGYQLAEDLRVQSAGKGPFKYIAGLYFSKDQLEWNDRYLYFGDVDFNGDGKLNNLDCQWSLANGYAPYGCIQSNFFNQQRKSTAGYADGTLDLNDVVGLRAGIRYTRDQIDIGNFRAQILGTDLVPLLNTIPGSTTDLNAVSPAISKSWSNVTGRLGVDVHVAGGGLLYGTLSTGYRAGAFNGQSFNAPDELSIANPEKLAAAELGFKGYALERRLVLTAEGFYYRYTNQQALNVDPTNFHQTEVNLSRSHQFGAELELSLQAVDSLRIGANVALLQTKVDDAVINGKDLTGKELALAPKFTGTAFVNWTLVQADTGTLKLLAQEIYVGHQWSDLFNEPVIAQGGHALTNARLTYDFTHEPLSVGLWGKNLGNKVYVTAATDVSGLGLNYFHLGQPRTFGAEATYKF